MGGYKPDDLTTKQYYDTFTKNNPGRKVSYESYKKTVNETQNKYGGAMPEDEENGLSGNGEIQKSRLFSLVDANVQDDSSLGGGSVQKAKGSIGGDDEAYSERMKGRFRKGLQKRG